MVGSRIVFGPLKGHRNRTVGVPGFVAEILAPLCAGKGRDGLLVEVWPATMRVDHFSERRLGVLGAQPNGEDERLSVVGKLTERPAPNHRMRARRHVALPSLFVPSWVFRRDRRGEALGTCQNRSSSELLSSASISLKTAVCSVFFVCCVIGVLSVCFVWSVCTVVFLTLRAVVREQRRH